MSNVLGPVASVLALGLPVAGAVAISFWPDDEQRRQRRRRKARRARRRAARRDARADGKG